MEVNECIYSRKSIRKYSDESICNENVYKLIEAGIMAPSGKNGQPWKFAIVSNNYTLLETIANESVNRMWLKKSKGLIVVFLDKSQSYDYIKDVQSVGAVIQNILLTANSLNIGSCWVGDLISKQTEVKKLLDIDNDDLKLMAIISLGYSKDNCLKTGRKSIDTFIVKEY